MHDEQRSSVANRPLAIIGIGCCLPGGANSPQAFWKLLCDGVDATSDVPADRWDKRKFYDQDAKKSGKMSTFHGGYLERLDLFDAQFFGISPREAMWLDPQQRMLLQVAWEALEDGGQVATALAGSQTGVFIGGFTLDYQLMQNFGVQSRYELQTHSATGMMMTMLANRLSYVFDFHGPSMAVDTACSGSLVAVHLACQSIWNGECTMALAGGANAMIAPTMTIAESKGGFLSPDGRCKTFDASANGYARGEGAGVVVIKPLDQALADGDPIYALIRGTAVVQDGHTNGITVPSGSAQEQVMRSACARAGISPHEVQYVEAHGTGTPVGDPIEARAIGSVFAAGRPQGETCVVGSVKTNIGHLEAAAGVAGLIKAALALRHRQIPPLLHFRTPNPAIPFEQLQLHVPTTLEPWPSATGPARAGVNSFGFGGTNAHVILEEAPAQPSAAPPAEDAGPYLLPLSARSPEALGELASAYRERLAQGDAPLAAVASSAALRRAHHDHRMAVVAHTRAEAIERLGDEARQGVAAGRVPLGERPKVAFVCSGMGPQWWAMGRDLLANEPIFRASIERCAAALQPYTGWSLLDELLAPEAGSKMDETEYAQPANFALQIALAELWRSWGIVPDAIIGHSAGELAAHYLAGVLSFEDAVRGIYHRSRLQQRISGQGRMLAVGMTLETLHQAIRDVEGVSIAAINSPSSITLVGDAAVLEGMAQQLTTFNVFHRFIKGKVPYHSHYMEPLHDELVSSLADLQPQRAAVPLYSTVTGTRIDGRNVDAGYWWQNVRATVLFASAIGQMIQDGYTTFVELSPHPVLASPIRELLAQQQQEGLVLPSLQRKEEDRAVMLGSLGALYTQGAPVAWRQLFPEARGYVPLPRYPWQLRPYWTESVESREDRLLTEIHPLLGQRMSAVHPTWQLELSPHRLRYLPDHRIQENVLLPGTAYIEMALAAAHEVFGEGDYAVEDVTFRRALFVGDGSDPRLQTVVNPQQALVEISSYTPTSEPHWQLHATATLRPAGALSPAPQLEEARGRLTSALSKEAFYQQSREQGFQYGPAFQAIGQIESGHGFAIGQLIAPEALADDLADYHFHPAILDAAVQVLLAAARTVAPSEQGAPGLYLPVGVRRVRVLGRAAASMVAYAQIRQAGSHLLLGDITVLDQQGQTVALLEGFEARSIEASLGVAADRIDRSLYEMGWLAQARDAEPRRAIAGGGWLITLDAGGVGAALAHRLRAEGERCITVAHAPAPAPQAAGGDSYTINRGQPEHYRWLCGQIGDPVARVAHLWGLDARADGMLAALEHAQQLGCISTIFLMQALAQSGWSELPRLWLVSQRAQAIAPGDDVEVAQAPLWGLGRVIGHQEFGTMWGGLIDLDAGSAELQAELLRDELLHASEEDQIAFRDGQRYVARLAPSTRLTTPLPPHFRPDASYLITGGLGALGMLVARWMVEQGARRLILMGRSQLPSRAEWHTLPNEHPQHDLVRAIQTLESQGASVTLASVDVADPDQLRAFLADYQRQGWPPIRGLIHTAGVVRDDLLLRMQPETFAQVAKPKILGGWNLHMALREHPLDFFILFGSTGSTIASLGQGNYAAANAFLDALAMHRQAGGLPALTIGWGPWSIGMVEQLHLESFYAKRGIELITPEAGMQILARVLHQRPAQLVAIMADWAAARAAAPLGALPPMFASLGAQVAEADTASATESGILALLAQAAPAERQSVLIGHLHDLVARVLQLDHGQFSPKESLTSLGIDSMMAIELKHRIEASTHVGLSVLDLLQGTSVEKLADHLLAAMLPSGQPDAPAADEQALSIDAIQQAIGNIDQATLEQLLAELEQTPDAPTVAAMLEGAN